MKTFINSCMYMKKVELKNSFAKILVVVLVIFSYQLSAQHLERQNVGSAGTSTISDGTVFRQTVGQPYSTNTSYTDDVQYRPGFQQPVLKVNLIHTSIDMNVFPNPTASTVTMQSTKTLKNVLLTISDVSGKIVLEQRMDEFLTFSFNCSDWGNGVYLIALADGQNNSYSSKLIVMK